MSFPTTGLFRVVVVDPSTAGIVSNVIFRVLPVDEDGNPVLPGGGGGSTLPTTTAILKGDGAGGAAAATGANVAGALAGQTIAPGNVAATGYLASAVKTVGTIPDPGDVPVGASYFVTDADGGPRQFWNNGGVWVDSTGASLSL
jgi:hypothetical protein